MVIAHAQAATFDVTSLADAGPGTLRDAMAQANAAPGADVITFSVSGTIALTSGPIVITGPLTIQGPGAANLAIDGGATQQIFLVYDAGAAGCPNTTGPVDYLATISGLALQNAAHLADVPGGAIQSYHSLVLDAVVIRGNRAKVGAGVSFHAQYAGQSLSITNSQIVDNTAKQLSVPTTGALGGAGVAVVQHCVSGPTQGVSVTIANTLLSGNRLEPDNLGSGGGALGIQQYADVVVTDSRIVDNVGAPPTTPGTPVRAGAIAANGFRSLRIERSEIAGNVAEQYSAIVLANSNFALQAPANVATARLVNTTVTGNVGTSGSVSAVVLGNVAVELFNSTYANNLPSGPGGNPGILFVSGPGLAKPTLKLESSIVHNPSGGGLDIGIDSTIPDGLNVTANRSLIGKIDAYNGAVNFLGTGSGNLLGLDPMLGALAFNGGTTRTMPLLTASPAIDAGSNPLSLTVDQRAGAYGRVLGPAADMGAFEYPASCAGLTDVDYAGAFCSSAGWIKNRDVTQGCGPGSYCPESDVIRLSMAAFMKRLGTPLTGVIAGTQQSSGPLDPDGTSGEPTFVCVLGINGEIPAVKYPRRAHVDGTLNGIASGTIGAQIDLIAAFDWGGGSLITLASARGTLGAGRWTQLHALGHLDVPAGQPLAVALILSRGGLPGTDDLSDSTCNVRVRLESRDGTSAPFDTLAQ